MRGNEVVVVGILIKLGIWVVGCESLKWLGCPDLRGDTSNYPNLQWNVR